jgi:DNA polymerase-3 subunit gamma/tau
MGKALYRKYRSRSLDEIVGQEHVTAILKNAIAQDRIGHAYLFTGPRGVGKTSIARILAHEINELPYSDESAHLDIIEIDAASNNGVDDIRDLREKVTLTPTSAKKKIYIIDEVHMLSKPAFNALLKTLEEPPAHVVFILATTDIDKLPETIISRTQRYTFKQASPADIVVNLERIVAAEKISIATEALELIATYSGGSYRDSVSLLDQLASIHTSDKEISVSDIESALGLASSTAIHQLLEGLVSKDFSATTSRLQQLIAGGIQPTIIATQIIQSIQSSLDDFGSLLPLIKDLIEVKRSPMPDALLLATLGTYASEEAVHVTPHTKAAAVAAPAIPVAEIPALAKKATQKKPKDDLVITTTPETPHEPEVAPAKSKQVAHDNVPLTSSIDWPTIIKDLSELSIGLRTVIGKCSFADIDDTVVVYARNEFYKKKLDTPKYRQELTTLLREKTGKEWELDFKPTTAPLKNQTIASVAAIMGGGEEVSIE